MSEQFGKLDYAMNNAGFGIPAKPLDECTSEEVNKVIGICLIAVTNCMIEEIKIMKENGFGRIVNTSSGAGLLGIKGYSVYYDNPPQRQHGSMQRALRRGDGGKGHLQGGVRQIQRIRRNYGKEDGLF